MFDAVVAFATSLFWGGNAVVQDSLVATLEGDTKKAFIRTFSATLRQALMSFKDWKSEMAFVLANFPEMTSDLLLVEKARTGLRATTAVLRFLQLLCEGHHLPLQDYLREQPGGTAANIPNEIMQFLDEVGVVRLSM